MGFGRCWNRRAAERNADRWPSQSVPRRQSPPRPPSDAEENYCATDRSSTDGLFVRSEQDGRLRRRGKASRKIRCMRSPGGPDVEERIPRRSDDRRARRRRRARRVWQRLVVDQLGVGVELLDLPEPPRSTSRSRRRSPRPSSRRARSRSPPTRATLRTSSSAPTARPSRAWTQTWPRRSPACMGLKANVVNATLRRDHPGPRGEEVRPRNVVVHRHQGAREDGRLRDLPLGGHVLLRQGAGRPDDQHARRPLRPQGCRREGHDAGHGRRPRRARSARRRASRA